ncbi:MAG TPA: NUDIX domain-containing protein [Bryobacteraceae bacterium]|nr:NUDIX domain-containing protein [Bryobacteraceae bacterium]
MISSSSTLELVGSFVPADDDLAAKSQELILSMLRHTDAPFSRKQFKPGHITCTAVVLSPDATRVLLMYHHRHARWLLPGGHVENEDATLAVTARREANEETGVLLAPSTSARLVGMDVHGIPAKKREPFHLHHDLIFALRAESEHFHVTDEAPRIAWCRPEEFVRFDVPLSIARSAARALEYFAEAGQGSLGF